MSGGGGPVSQDTQITVEPITKDAAEAIGCLGQKHYVDNYAVPHLQLEAKQANWQEILAGIVGTYGYIETWKLNERMVDVAEKQVRLACENFDFVQDQYEEVFKPIYLCSKDYWNYYRQCFGGFEKDYVDKAFEDCEYIPEYKAVAGRINAQTQQSLVRARNIKKNTQSVYACGGHAYDTLMFAHWSQRANTDAIARGYRQEDEKSLRLMEFYWNRKTAAMSQVSAIGQRSAGLLTGSGSVASAGLGAIGSALGGISTAYGALANANTNQADFFTGISNGAFRLAGYSGFGRTAVDPQQLNLGQGGLFFDGGNIQRLDGGSLGVLPGTAGPSGSLTYGNSGSTPSAPSQGGGGGSYSSGWGDAISSVNSGILSGVVT